MKPRIPNRKTIALTLVEVLVVVVLLFILAAVILPIKSDHMHTPRSMCVNNLKQISVASLIWASDHNGKFPMQVSVTNGGAKELALAGDVAGTFCTMSNVLVTPKILWCPSDKSRIAAKDFASGFSNENISYFVGLDADMDHPQAFLSGDDNFSIGGVPVKSGLLQFSTNTPIAFTSERHDNGGNIGFADGSVQEAGGGYSWRQMLVETGVATNRLAIP